MSVTAEVTCNPVTGRAAPVSFSNTPLTNLTVSVGSQVNSGTASFIDCDPPTTPPDDPTQTVADGDGSVAPNNLVRGTYTCTVVIDP